MRLLDNSNRLISRRAPNIEWAEKSLIVFGDWSSLWTWPVSLFADQDKTNIKNGFGERQINSNRNELLSKTPRVLASQISSSLKNGNYKIVNPKRDFVAGTIWSQSLAACGEGGSAASLKGAESQEFTGLWREKKKDQKPVVFFGCSLVMTI